MFLLSVRSQQPPANTPLSRSITKEGWLRLPYVRAWRERLVKKYIEGTVRSLQEHQPSLRQPNGRPLSRDSCRLELLRWGRTGVPARRVRVDSGRAERARRQLRVTRRQLCQGLDKVLAGTPQRLITVSKVLKRSRRSRTAFYDAFSSGMDGLFCVWVANEIDKLAVRTRTRFLQLRRTRDARSMLIDWTDLVAAFINERPYGRRNIGIFVTHEIDDVGTALTARLRQKRISHAEYLTREQRVDEFAELAAECHRAGARLIHEVQLVFERPDSPRILGPALEKRVWGSSKRKRESVPWNLAVGYWEAFTGMGALGFLEAERVADHHRRFMLHALTTPSADPKH